MNTLFTVVGNSGAGKTTIMRKTNLLELVSFTTRQPREGESNGVDYYFIDDAKFNALYQSGQVIEHHNHFGTHYGLTAEEFYGKMAKGNAFSIVDIHGMNMLKALYPKTVSIFIYNTYEEAVVNMKARGDSDDKIAKRLETYHWEVAQRKFCDFVVKNTNGKLGAVTNIIQDIVASVA
ncbi:hypothetical protein QB910_000098 [Dabrowskivirus KKP3916]|uniref:Guanylate kinase-like domain-containing protein n=1 Tax=Alicyclobacillus phage KKP_3916 TaxID=3040651 RepID=A0AAT9V8T2_9CAUD|nr:hypothetical protein QB910_000098 [Alicyclobacillus phage KKP 3916]